MNNNDEERGKQIERQWDAYRSGISEILANRDIPEAEQQRQQKGLPPIWARNLLAQAREQAHKKKQRKDYMRKWREKLKQEHPIVWWRVTLKNGTTCCPRGRVKWQATGRLKHGYGVERSEIASVEKIGKDLK
jgi:hypothetical protein